MAGCPDREVSEVNPNQDKVEIKEIPLTINRDIDILFVIDNSVSMQDEQDRLLANFPVFIDVLSQIEGGLPNVQLGVVSSDVGTLIPTGDSNCSDSDRGNLLKGDPDVPGLCSQVNGQFIRSVDPDNSGPMPPVTNFTGTLQDAFSCTAALGATGCGFEQHLESMYLALNGNPVNTGFLRDDAYLAVIIVADEDDCSAENGNFFGPESPQLGPLDSFRCFEKGVRCNEGRDTELRDVGVKTGCVPDDTNNYLFDIEKYVTFLKGLKDNERDVIVAGIIGNTEPVEVGRKTPMGQTMQRPDLVPSCTLCLSSTVPCPQADTSPADPGIRLRAFFESFPDRFTFTTICDTDYSDALIQIAELLRTVIGFPCITAQLVDTDPSTPAIEPDCSFAYVTDPGLPTEMQQTLAKCDTDTGTPGNMPCWRLVTDADGNGMNDCAPPPETSGLAVKVERTSDPPDNTYIQGGCVVR
jgi:hypothetical protein